MSRFNIAEMTKQHLQGDISENKSFFSIEEELEEDYEDTPLTWRGSPSDTFSDCTLILTNKQESSKSVTYHVHRAVLGASDKRCLYFMKASQKNVNEIEIILDYKAAQEAFPAMLDFVYFGDLNIGTPNAEALRYLAEFLQCRPLRLAVNKFIEGDFNVANSIHYVRETHRFNDKPLLNVAVREAAKLFGQIDMDSFIKLEPELFAAIVTSEHFVCKDSDKLSKTILYFMHNKPECLNPALLVKLTQVVPALRAPEANAFLELIERIDVSTEDSPEGSWKALTDLCIRCSNAIAPQIWKEDAELARDQFFFSWNGDGASRLFVARLVASLKYAQDQCDIQHKAIEEVQDDVAKSQNEVSSLQLQMAEKTKLLAVREEAAAVVPEARDDAQTPGSPRYNEVCRDLAMSLSNKLNEKEEYIVELEAHIEQKETELEKVGQMMVHLNARLKFYEILHNDSKPASPKASRSNSRVASSVPNSPSRPLASSSTGNFESSTPTRSTTPRSYQKRQMSSRPENPMANNKPPTSPRFTFRHALE
mmetsp:Transcript_25448/g.42334  ORF Transcript_25448/g.42334 Transcript_25448/m.42334 type:complete len:536 (+) Transcript_25448:60-1667(+)|eukprot:CAMPEP_0119014422 /NCGR_PEP_ID=MMETSP1176-20130426/9701_1 /TAXON_ID=265551 /ORGANISM="Synedropsis recta cf, Strain CCMP1620" /LENGTH=535 /DNA_ID=CAMNT_0006967599 /DNA_START=51 /DNA_END=1658 /DNA_ORIENTATION=-